MLQIKKISLIHFIENNKRLKWMRAIIRVDLCGDWKVDHNVFKSKVILKNDLWFYSSKPQMKNKAIYPHHSLKNLMQSFLLFVGFLGFFGFSF